MGNFKINKLDLIIFCLTLESINISTPLGNLSIAFISILISTLFVFPKIKRYKISDFYPLIFFALWITIISFFQGNSLLGNLSRCYSLVYLGIIIPDLKINKIKVVSAFRRILNLHSFILILDYFFNVPWSWNNEDLFMIGINQNFNRATGLFLEPSYFGLTVNLILLILVISKQVKKRDFLIVIISSFLTSSLSAILGAILITSLYYFRFIIKNLINIFSERDRLRIEMKYLGTFIIFLLLISINLTNKDVVYRITNPYHDSSSMSRIFGSYFTFKKVLENSPIYGYGLGGRDIDKILESFGKTFTLDEVGGSKIETNHPANRIFRLSLVNIFVVLIFIGGLPLLIIFNYYLLNSFGISIYLIIFIILSFFTGSLWNPLYFLTPAISKFFKNNNK